LSRSPLILTKMKFENIDRLVRHAIVGAAGGASIASHFLDELYVAFIGAAVGALLMIWTGLVEIKRERGRHADRTS
jgi:hypothetical protein